MFSFLFDEANLYPLIGAALALAVYGFFFHEPKKSQREQYEVNEVLLEAAQAGNLDACKEAVEEDGAKLPSGPLFIDKPGKKSALHGAAQYGHNEIVEWLVLDKDVPVDIPDFAKMRPMHYAAMKGRTKTCKLLLKMKADITAKDTAQFTPVHFAASGGYEETLAVLKAAGGDVNDRDQGGNTPLMLASTKGKAAAVQWLLDNGADKFTWNNQEATAYDLALKRQHKAVVAILEGKPARTVPQGKRQAAEEERGAAMQETSFSTVQSGSGSSSLRQRSNVQPPAEEATKQNKEAAKAEVKKKLEEHAIEMAKKHSTGQAKAQKIANKMKTGGYQGFNAGMDPKVIKENFPDVWEAARKEIAEVEGGEDALESLLMDTVE